MVGDMDNTGSLNAQIIHQLTSAVRSKIAIQVCRLIEGTAFQMLSFRHFFAGFKCHWHCLPVSEYFLLYFLCVADSATQVCELAVWHGVSWWRFHRCCDARKSRCTCWIWYDYFLKIVLEVLLYTLLFPHYKFNGGVCCSPHLYFTSYLIHMLKVLLELVELQQHSTVHLWLYSEC